MHFLVRSLCIGFAYMLCMAMPCFAAEAGIGKIITLVPGVAVERGGQRIALALKDTIELHDTIVSDATGKAQIIFADDSTVTIGNNASLNMEAFVASGSKPVFKARLGRGLARIITGKVVEQNPEGFNISTPEAIVGIRGTVLAVRSEQGRTAVFVENTLHKQVFVNETLVPQGFKAIITAPGAAPVPQPMNEQDQKEIEQESTVASTNESQASLAAQLGNNGPNTPLADVNLGQQSLGQQNLGDNAVNAPMNAYVSGSLGAGDLGSGSGSGTFGFDVSLASGAITNAFMQGSGYASTPSSINTFSAHGGSGSIGNNAGGTETLINGFSFTALYDGGGAPLDISNSSAALVLDGSSNQAMREGSGNVTGQFTVQDNTGSPFETGYITGNVTPKP